MLLARSKNQPFTEVAIVTDIKRTTRKQYSAEEKIGIALDGFRGELIACAPPP